MTLFDEIRKHHVILVGHTIGLNVVGHESAGIKSIYNNSMRVISLYSEYIEKYGVYEYMSRETQLSANLLPSFDKLCSMEARLDNISLVVFTYSLATNFTVYESLRYSLDHWRALKSVTHEEVNNLIIAFEQRLKEKSISPRTIIDPFDSCHLEL